MKKYDLFLVVLYILVIIIGLVVFKNMLFPGNVMRDKARAYMQELYEQPVRVIVIRDTDIDWTVVNDRPLDSQGSFRLQGVMNATDTKCFRFRNDTLYISGPWKGYDSPVIHITPSVEVDTMGTAHVQIVNVQIAPQDTVSHGF